METVTKMKAEETELRRLNRVYENQIGLLRRNALNLIKLAADRIASGEAHYALEILKRAQLELAFGDEELTRQVEL